jgi:hypothetical protein
MFTLCIQQEKAPLVPDDMRYKSVGESSSKYLGFITTDEAIPPPIPPPPVNYQGGPIPRVSGLSAVLTRILCVLFYRGQVLPYFRSM